MPDGSIGARTKNEIPYAWFVNKPADVAAEDMEEWLAAGRWHSPSPDAHVETLGEVQVGDPIACKSVSFKRTGLPFFTADRAASVMLIHATGTVRSVDANAGLLEVDWRPLAEPRAWYFYTSVQSVWRVGDAREFSRALLAFTFHGAEQDIDVFLADPFWQRRFVPYPEFTWVNFYRALATRLAEFAEDRAPLVARFIDLARTEKFLSSFLEDQYPDGSIGPVTDIDPFTMMATFNRGLRTENRMRIATALAEALEVSAPLPRDFDGVPLVPNQNFWFTRYAKNRGPGDIDTLWQVFLAALALAEEDSPANREEFATAYDAALDVSNVRWNLSQGLYWARPDTFVTLEGRSRPYLAHRFDLAAPQDGASYLALTDELQRIFRSGRTSITSYPLLSYAAWTVGSDETTPRTVGGFAEWAVRFAQVTDLDVAEHGYKRRAARTLREAREQLVSDDPTWTETFATGLKQAANLLHYMFRDDVITAVKAEPTYWADVFREVWRDGSPAALDPLTTALRQRLPRAYVGACTSLGALLLMAVDVENNAPYLTSRTEQWYQLTDFPGPADKTSASERYATLLRFLDELAGEVSAQTQTSVTRLEAQGMAWTVTDGDVPETWDPKTAEGFKRYRGDQERPPRAWLIRPRQLAIEEWLAGAQVSLRAEYLGEVSPGATWSTVQDAVEAGYPQAEYPERQALTHAFHALLSRMAPNDVVASLDGQELHLGRITGEVAAVDGRLQRDTDWWASLPTATLSERISSELDQQGIVVEITDALPDLEALLTGDIEGTEEAEPTPASDTGHLSFPEISDAFAASVHMPVDFLADVTDLLFERRQIILYGPPGTGKTYLALELAKYLAGPDHPDNVQLVQFHPSYSYEDFFEGFRPAETDAGTVTFTVRPGPLRRIAQEARQNSSTPYFLVIDELNRANLAKVFGELYFLLEYRRRSVQLQYSHEQFRLPENLFFIGTMNTADRSVALLDAAMRRRFAFVELHPDEAPVATVLERFLAGVGEQDERPRLLAALNAAIDDDDRDFKIGPSYLMRPEAATDRGLQRIWRYDILPLLQEHYYGRLSPVDVAARFGLEALRSQVHTGWSAPSEVSDLS